MEVEIRAIGSIECEKVKEQFLEFYSEKPAGKALQNDVQPGGFFMFADKINYIFNLE
jgi:hypothetical protein